MTLSEMKDKRDELAVAVNRIQSELTRAKVLKRHKERDRLSEEYRQQSAALAKLNGQIKAANIDAWNRERAALMRHARQLLFLMKGTGFPCPTTRDEARKLAAIAFSPDEETYKHYAFEEIEL